MDETSGGVRGRAKGLLRRQKNQDTELTEQIEAESASAGEERALTGLADEALREQLHATVDRTMDAHVGGGTDKAELKAALRRALDAVVDDSVTAASLREKITRGMQGGWDKLQGSSPNVDQSVNRLKDVLGTAFASSQPGAKEGTAAPIRKIPQLVGVLTTILTELIADEQKVRQFQQQAVKMLKKHMDPKMAERVVEAAIGIARAAAQRRAKRSKDEPGR